MPKYQEKLIEMVKAAGQELIDNAESFAQGDTPFTTDFNILIRIPSASDSPDSMPTIMVQREYFAKKILKVQFPDVQFPDYDI